MTSLVSSAPTPFPTPLAPWYTHSTLNTVSSNFVTIYRPNEELWVNQVTPDDIPPSQPPMPTGPQHWEQQRKEWLKDCKKGVPPVNQNDPFNARLQTADYYRLVQLYKDITNEARPFRRSLRLSQLIPILVAGWKDAGLWPNEESLRAEILQHRLNPEDYDLKVHLSGILDSDAPPEKAVNIAVSRVLARQNSANKQH